MVLDDRADYANRERFPEPVEIRVLDSFKTLPELDIDEDSYFVIVSRGHISDKDILEQVVRSDAAYIGMIGSRSKRDTLYAEIVRHSFEREELERVHAQNSARRRPHGPKPTPEAALSTLAAWKRGHERHFQHLNDQAFEAYAQMPWGR